MTEYSYPATDWDRPNNLLASLGSFWSETYGGHDQLLTTLAAKGQVENQTIQDLLETIAALCRYDVPIYHTDNWYALQLLRSECNTTAAPAAVPRHDGTLSYDGTHQYDAPLAVHDAFSWPIPANLVSANLLLNRMTEPSLVLCNELDFAITAGNVTLYADPFQDARVTKQPVYLDGVVVDEVATLWVFRGQFDWEQVYRQFAYVLGLKLQSSSGYRDIMNAVFDSIVGGTTQRAMQLAMSVITGIPLVVETEETVVEVTTDANHLLVVTDQHAYRFKNTATATAAVGDVVHTGDSLVDALAFYELNRGDVPTAIPALAMGAGFLASCYYGDLVFENKSVPLETTEAEDAPYGYTYVRFGLGGFPLDVTKFFDDMHLRGIAEAERPIAECEDVETITIPEIGMDDRYIRRGTLAHRLDTRTTRVGEPTAAALPATINPLQFLVANVLRNNLTVIRVNMSGLGADALGLHHAELLHRIMPPHTAVIVLVVLDTEVDSIDPAIYINDSTVTTLIGVNPRVDTILAADIYDGT